MTICLEEAILDYDKFITQKINELTVTFRWVGYLDVDAIDAIDADTFDANHAIDARDAIDADVSGPSLVLMMKRLRFLLIKLKEFLN